MDAEKQKLLRKRIHDVVIDCCVHDINGLGWLMGPVQVENHIIDVLLPEAADFPEEKKKSTKELLEDLAGMTTRFKMMMDSTDKAQKTIMLSDVELDAARYRTKVEVLTWVLGHALPDSTSAGIARELADAKRQLEVLERVVGNEPATVDR